MALRSLATAALLALMALGGRALADDLRGCTEAELATAVLAPMPGKHESLNDLSTDHVRLAGYLLTIDGKGVPTVVCAIEVMTDPLIRDRGAEAVAKFVYWPADVTAPGKLVYVHLQSQGYGVTIPSVLPRATDPVCDPSMVTEDTGIKPTFRPKPLYPHQNIRDGVTGAATVIVRVEDTGASYLFCQAAGSNIERLVGGAYYAAAGFRFPAQPGRAPFTYSITFEYMIRD